MSEDAAAEELKLAGDQHTRNRRYKQADDSYTRALEIDPKAHCIYSNRSLVRLKLDDAKGAVADATMATELKPDWAKGWARLGAAERVRGNLLEASEAYAQAHDLDPTNKEFDRLLHEVETQYSDGIFHAATAGAAASGMVLSGGSWRLPASRKARGACTKRAQVRSGGL